NNVAPFQRFKQAGDSPCVGGHQGRPGFAAHMANQFIEVITARRLVEGGQGADGSRPVADYLPIAKMGADDNDTSTIGYGLLQPLTPLNLFNPTETFSAATPDHWDFAHCSSPVTHAFCR